MQPNDFINAVQSLNFDNVFNPYTDTCLKYDTESAPESRSHTLCQMISAAMKQDIDSLWIGRDLGHRGGRRTGLALTDDVHITAHVERWKLPAPYPTKGEPFSERTAKVIWSVLKNIDNSIFLWNVFPLHPYEPDNQFSNRSHNAEEHRVGEEILDQLIKLLNPRKLVAIGNDADKTAKRLSGQRQVSKVRHPSYGGQTEFLTQIQDLYSLNDHGIAF